MGSTERVVVAKLPVSAPETIETFVETPEGLHSNRMVLQVLDASPLRTIPIDCFLASLFMRAPEFRLFKTGFKISPLDFKPNFMFWTFVERSVV